MKQFVLCFIITISVISKWLVAEDIRNPMEEKEYMGVALMHEQICHHSV